MYLLILVSFLHLGDTKPEPVSIHKTEAECLVQAGRMNRSNLNDTPRAAGVQYVCFAIVYPT